MAEGDDTLLVGSSISITVELSVLNSSDLSSNSLSSGIRTEKRDNNYAATSFTQLIMKYIDDVVSAKSNVILINIL